MDIFVTGEKSKGHIASISVRQMADCTRRRPVLHSSFSFLFHTMPSPVLEVTDLTFRRGRPILKGISWRVDPGQHWCILGPNGCGKTSLINLITGYDSATGGTLRIGDSVFGDDDWREVRRRVGLVTNTLTTYLESSEPVLDVIASGREAKLNLIELPFPHRLREAARLLNQVGCTYLASRPLGPALPRRETKSAHLPRLDGQIQSPHPRRTLRRSRSRRPRALTSSGCKALAANRSPLPSSWSLTTSKKSSPASPTASLLKDGSGPCRWTEARQSCTSRNLSHIYGAPVKFMRHGDRYSLRLA
jgi:iron complex transport system ATP-binding protein